MVILHCQPAFTTRGQLPAGTCTVCVWGGGGVIQGAVQGIDQDLQHKAVAVRI